MRLTEIAHGENPGRSSLLRQAEAKFNAACQEIESGNWDKAREICEKLSQQALPSELADAVRIMKNILDPANSPSETAKKIAHFLPGRFFRVYDDQNGWNDDAMRELADAQRDLS
jgi:hypothetical protein